MDDGLYVCIRVLFPFLFLESNLNVPVNIFLTEQRFCPSNVKQTSKEIWRGKKCLISHSSTGGACIEPVESNTLDKT